MAQAYQAPERRLDERTALVIMRTPWYRGVPARNIPLDQRTGMIQVIQGPNVTIRGPEQEDVYPHGASYEMRPGYTIAVEVLGRGLDERAYAQKTERPPNISGLYGKARRLGTQTPMIAPAECYSGNVSSSTHDRLRLVPSSNLARYLLGALPLIGVADGDLRKVVNYIQAYLVLGRRQLTTW